MHRRLLSEPCWDGIPQKIETTLRHSHRKWKSPVYTWNCVFVHVRGEIGMVGKEERDGV